MNIKELNQLINNTGEATNISDIEMIKKSIMRRYSPSKARDLKQSFQNLVREYQDKFIDFKGNLSDDEYLYMIRCYLSQKDPQSINCNEELENIKNIKIIPYDDCIPTMDDYFGI